MADRKYFSPKIFRDFSLGTIRRVNNAIAPLGSFKLALNNDSDHETGSLVSRLGTTILGAQESAGFRCFGIGNYMRTSLDASVRLDESGGTRLAEDGGSRYLELVGKKLFGVFETASDNTIFDMLDGTSDLTGDTSGKKTRFCAFLDSIVRVNGFDAAKAYDNNNWITTGGVFDLANMPLFHVIIEWQDRVWGATPDSDKLYYSSIAASSAISWTDATPITGAGFIYLSQEDGGGGITALEKVPGYLIIFKQRAMKRWDGNTTFPEDLIAQGVHSQECVTRSRELCYFINQSGIWVTNGAYPVRISRAVQDFVDAISDWNKVSCIGDDKHVFFSIGNITIGLDTYTNCVLKYNIEDKTFDVRSYYNGIAVMARYTDVTNTSSIIFGDDDGQILKLDDGYTDYATTPKGITWTVEPQEHDWGMRGNIKDIQKMYVYTENVSTGKALCKVNNGDFNEFGVINKPVVELKNPKFIAKGNTIAYKFTGTTNSGRSKFLGYEFPSDAVIYNQNTDE